MNRKKMSMPDWVVVATMTPWDEPPRLRHQITRALSRYYRILYIEFPTNWRRKYAERWSQPEPQITVWRPSSWFHLPWRLTAQNWPALQFEIFYLRTSLQRWLKSTGVKPLALVSFDYRHAWLMDHRLFPKTIYICNDDFTLFAPTPRLASLVQRQMQETANSADVCLVTSEFYLQILGAGSKARVFVPGHDLPLAIEPRVRPYRVGDCIKVGYMGYIDRKLGLGYIKRVAREHDMEFHMIGPVTDPSLQERLTSLGVYLYSPQTGEPLLKWLLEMDVLIMPYDLPERWSKGVSTPNKTFAYFAAGKPIIVSSLPNFLDWGEYNVYHAGTPDEFVTQIRRARSEDSPDKARSRIELAREYSWDKRITILVDLIRAQGDE